MKLSELLENILDMDKLIKAHLNTLFHHRGPTKCVCVADCYYIVKLDLPFASPIAIYR